MNNGILKLAVIGGSNKSAVGSVHNIACRMDHRFNVTAAVFSMNEATNIETAQAWNVDQSKIYKNHRQLIELENNDIDAAVIITPTQTHADIVADFLEAGIPVICEKSLTMSVKDAKRVKSIISHTNGFLAVTYNYVGYPMVREMRGLIENGAIGEVTQIHIEMPQDGYIRLDDKGKSLTPQAWRLDESSMPIISTDLGIHLSNLIGFLSSESPSEVFAIQNSIGNFKVIDNVICVAKYTNNLICNIWYSKAALGYRNGLRIRVFGKFGSLAWTQTDPETLIVTNKHGTVKHIDRASSEAQISSQKRYNRFKSGHPSGYIEAFANCYYDISESLLRHIKGESNESDYVFSIDHALTDIKMIDAMNRSAMSNNWITID